MTQVQTSTMKSIVQPWDWVVSCINLIYLDKIKADIDDFKDGKPLMNLRQFTVHWFLVWFGYWKIAETILQDFLRSLIEYEPEHEWFRTFLNLCGIHVFKGDLNLWPKDWKWELLREWQFESTENLKFFLKVIHCLWY